MLIIPSLVLVASFLAQVTVLAVPIPLNHDLSIHARAPSLDGESKLMLVTRSPVGESGRPARPQLRITIPGQAHTSGSHSQAHTPASGSPDYAHTPASSPAHAHTPPPPYSLAHTPLPPYSSAHTSPPPYSLAHHPGSPPSYGQEPFSHPFSHPCSQPVRSKVGRPHRFLYTSHDCSPCTVIKHVA
ncbi:hypothetical protein BYT27DRAFT_6463097 [Phlegmacium glaucopus]|nr:hypothetical protein BYT27DRAFT_6463097 [Phlegmacium glaucopus]